VTEGGVAEEGGQIEGAGGQSGDPAGGGKEDEGARSSPRSPHTRGRNSGRGVSNFLRWGVCSILCSIVCVQFSQRVPDCGVKVANVVKKHCHTHCIKKQPAKNVQDR